MTNSAETNEKDVKCGVFSIERSRMFASGIYRVIRALGPHPIYPGEVISEEAKKEIKKMQGFLESLKAAFIKLPDEYKQPDETLDNIEKTEKEEEQI